MTAFPGNSGSPARGSPGRFGSFVRLTWQMAAKILPAMVPARAGRRPMKTWGVLILSVVLAGCASAPAPDRADRLLNDHLFAAPSERISAADVFALSDDMRAYLRGQIADELRAKGPQSGLINCLYDKQQLKHDYHAEITRNTADTV